MALRQAEWQIPARVITDVVVYVKAATKAEAIRKFRCREWDEQSDQEVYTVHKTGKCERVQ